MGAYLCGRDVPAAKGEVQGGLPGRRVAGVWRGIRLEQEGDGRGQVHSRVKGRAAFVDGVDGVVLVLDGVVAEGASRGGGQGGGGAGRKDGKRVLKLGDVPAFDGGVELGCVHVVKYFQKNDAGDELKRTLSDSGSLSRVVG